MSTLSLSQPTYDLGGVEEPTGDELAKMQEEDYVLHARGGALSKISVEKSVLPHDPFGHTQTIELAQGPDGAIYANLTTVMCKSTDGGRTWQAHDTADRDWIVKTGQEPHTTGAAGSVAVLEDDRFIGIRAVGEDEHQKLVVFASDDQWRTRQPMVEIDNPMQCPYRDAGAICRREPDALLVPIESRYRQWRDPTYVHCSTDGGRTWTGPTMQQPVGGSFFGSFCYENMIATLPSGRLLGVSRYHGPVMPRWPVINPGYAPFCKTVFLVDSTDGGETWQNLRPLTNVFGQCHGYAVALGDGSVIVTHDHRYPPGTPCGRAMVSRDEAQTWQDEVYYLYFGKLQSGYSQSIVLEDDVILTVGAVAHDRADGPEVYTSWCGHTAMTAIRWKLID